MAIRMVPSLNLLISGGSAKAIINVPCRWGESGGPEGPEDMLWVFQLLVWEGADAEADWFWPLTFSPNLLYILCLGLQEYTFRGKKVSNRQENLIHLQVLIDSYAPFLLTYKNEKEKKWLVFYDIVWNLAILLIGDSARESAPE